MTIYVDYCHNLALYYPFKRKPRTNHTIMRWVFFTCIFFDLFFFMQCFSHSWEKHHTAQKQNIWTNLFFIVFHKRKNILLLLLFFYYFFFLFFIKTIQKKIIQKSLAIWKKNHIVSMYLRIVILWQWLSLGYFVLYGFSCMIASRMMGSSHTIP